MYSSTPAGSLSTYLLTSIPTFVHSRAVGATQVFLLLGSSNPQKSLVGGAVVTVGYDNSHVVWSYPFVGYDLYGRSSGSSFLCEGPVGWLTNCVLPRSDGGVSHVLHVTPKRLEAPNLIDWQVVI